MSRKKQYLVSGYRAGENDALIGIRTNDLENALELAKVALYTKKDTGVIRVTVESFDASTLKEVWASYE